MSLLTLLDIVNQAEGELGLPMSLAVAGATSGQALQMRALANSCGRKLTREHGWGDLETQGTIATVAAQSVYATPSDYSRMVFETQWDTSTKWSLTGSVTPQLFRALTEGLVVWPANRVIFRQKGFTRILIYPTPVTSALTYDFSYISNKWATSGTGAPQTQFLSDSDLTLLDADLFVADLKWRFAAAKGLGMAEALKEERDDVLALLIANDLGARTLNLGQDEGGVAWDVAASSIPGNTIFSIGDQF